jgi:hypothetical protein
VSVLAFFAGRPFSVSAVAVSSVWPLEVSVFCAGSAAEGVSESICIVSSFLSASAGGASAEEVEGAVAPSEVVLRFEEDDLEGDSSVRQLWEKAQTGR